MLSEQTETPVPQATKGSALGALRAVEAVDFLLLAMVRRRAVSVSLEPRGDGQHVVTLEREVVATVVGCIPSALAEGMAARMALLCGRELQFGQETLGRLRLRVDAGARSAPSGRGEVFDALVSVRHTPEGIELETRRLVAVEPGGLRGVARPDEPVAHARLGAYRILHELGRGGTAVVYLGEHGVLAKPVAIKVLLPHLSTDPDMCARFILEARATSRVRHPGVVSITDFGSLPDGRSYMVMELLDGQPLEKMLEAGPVPTATALRIARQAAEALAASHAQGVVHRDVKPANIFLEAQRVKLVDFGAAKLLDGPPSKLTRRGIVMGTPHYLPPEATAGVSDDARSDVYSLGCVVFELLTGSPPYDGDSEAQVIQMHKVAPTPRLPQNDAYDAPALQAVIDRCLHKDRAGRFPSGAELAVALRTMEDAHTR